METIREALTEAITYLNTLESEQAEQRIRALHYFVMLIANRRPSDEHDELIDLVNQHSGEEEVELMAKSMADVMREEGIKAGITEGIEQGKAQGIEQGKAQGEMEAKQVAIIKLLTHQFPDIPHTFVEAIHEIQERARLDTLFDQILIATSFDDIDLNGIGS